jgi:hypothetical protein
MPENLQSPDQKRLKVMSISLTGMCLLVMASGLNNLFEALEVDRPFKLVLAIVMVVAGAIGFALNLSAALKRPS